jgi:plastocyanin
MTFVRFAASIRFAVAAALAVAIAACSGSAPSPTPILAPTAEPALEAAAPVAAPSTSPAPLAATVGIVDFSFEPGTITIAEGGSVTFENQGAAPHTVRTPSSESPILDSGGRYVLTFPVAGTVSYLCGLHPDMTGEVVVVAATRAPGPEASPEPTATASPEPTETASPEPSATASPEPSATAGPSARPVDGGGAAAPGSVRIVDSTFQPGRLTVAPGARVTFLNADDRPHSVRFDGDESPILDSGRTYERTFSSAGTFAYVCGLHPEMTGTIVVAAGAGGGSGGAGSGSADDPVTAALGRVDAYRAVLAEVAPTGAVDDRARNLRDRDDRVAAEIGEGDLDGARSKAEDLLEDTADAIARAGRCAGGRRVIDAAEAVVTAVFAL